MDKEIRTLKKEYYDFFQDHTFTNNIDKGYHPVYLCEQMK